MKKIIILLMIILNISFLFAEHIDIPISVLLESKTNEFEVEEFQFQEEKEKREINEKNAEIEYLREKLEEYKEEEVPKKKWDIFSKKKKKTRKKVREENNGIDLQIKINTILAGETGIGDVNTNISFGGELELIKPTNILGGLEFGGGLGININAFDLTTTDGGIQTSLSAIELDPDIYGITSYNFISIPLYGTIKYNFNSENIILKDIYIFSQLGYCLNIGNVPSAIGGMYYSIGTGKTFKGFSFDVKYVSMSTELDFGSDFAADDSLEEELEQFKYKIDLNRIAINFGYKFNLRRFF